MGVGCSSLVAGHRSASISEATRLYLLFMTSCSFWNPCRARTRVAKHERILLPGPSVVHGICNIWNSKFTKYWSGKWRQQTFRRVNGGVMKCVHIGNGERTARSLNSEGRSLGWEWGLRPERFRHHGLHSSCFRYDLRSTNNVELFHNDPHT